MDDKPTVPYIVHESAIARMERITKRLVVALIISIILIFASNGVWLYFFNQYDIATETLQTVTVDGKSGIANYIGNSGDIVNGKDNSDNAEKKTDEKKER